MKRILLILLVLPVFAKGQTIITFAGNGTAGYGSDGVLATTTELYQPAGIAVDKAGNIYIADGSNNRVRKVNSSGIITTIAGIGTAGYSGDNGPSTSAELSYPAGVALDDSGNIYIADSYNNVVRKVNVMGIISTIAGNGYLAGTGLGAYSGDGVLATSAELYEPLRLAIDSHRNLYISDTKNDRIRKVDTMGIITTVTGNGTGGYYGDGGMASAAEVSYPIGIAVDGNGDIYFADQGNNRVRKIVIDGTITTIAGNGTPGYTGDGIIATAAELNVPLDLSVDSIGNVYIADTHNNLTRKVDISGIITSIAGNDTDGYSGDGGIATNAKLYWPDGIAYASSGDVFISDFANNRIREIINLLPLDVPFINGKTCEVNLFPNPTPTNFLTITSSDKITSVAITNLIGQTVYNNAYHNEEVQVDVSNLPAGMYLIRINGTEVRKFVKQ